MKIIGKTLYLTTERTYLHCDNYAIMVELASGVKQQIAYQIIADIIVMCDMVLSPYIIYQCSLHGISISYISPYGKFLGCFNGPKTGNVLLRYEQFKMIGSARGNEYVKNTLAAKIKNEMWLLRYTGHHSNFKSDIIPIIQFLKGQKVRLKTLENIDDMRILEANCASRYFSVFDKLIRTEDASMQFEKRTHHPSLNNTNALLSLLYTITTSYCTSALLTRGLDPECGYLHTLRSGRNSLACDLVEEFRSPIVDRFVITVINRKEIISSDFELLNDGICLTKDGKKKLFEKWDRYINTTEVVHQLYGKKMVLKFLIYEQAQLLAQYIRGDIEQYPAFIMVE